MINNPQAMEVWQEVSPFSMVTGGSLRRFFQKAMERFGYNIQVSNKIPTSGGFHIAYFPEKNESKVVMIVEDASGNLHDLSGGEHFSKWKCKWSGPITIAES